MITEHAKSSVAFVDVAALKQEAKRLYEQEILPRWGNQDNAWRTAWAMDTILDYYSVCKADGSTDAERALQALDPMANTNWWDDFGWIGIAALRAAEQNAYPKHRDSFVKIAINAWAYMYGLGWSIESGAPVYPFTGDELPGWAQFSRKSDIHRSGASRVWKDIRETWKGVTEQEVAERAPRYSPGGAWNSPITDAGQPYLVPNYSGDAAYLNPIQNTVTNGLYTILALRIYQASRNRDFAHVFSQSTLNIQATIQAWADQIRWLNSWMVETSGDESLLMDLGAGSLVRERVSTFDNRTGTRYWDAAYRKDLAWTGDQGLIMGALREAKASGDFIPAPPVLEQYVNIMIGTFRNAFAPRAYGNVQGVSLLPWVAGKTDPLWAYFDFPQGDNPDYQTGTAVFMRYLLQLYRAEPARIQMFGDLILSSATQIVLSPTGAPNPPGSCDAFTPYTDDPVAQLTPCINRLSVILMAIAMAGQP